MGETLLWLIAGLVLIGVEVITGTFVLLMLGGGALAAGVAAFLGAPAVVELLVFAVVSVVLLFGVRPALRRRMHPALDPALERGHDPVGHSALVVARVDRDSGQVKIDGELWSARSLDHGRAFEPGERVTVLQLSGVTALVGAEL